MSLITKKSKIKWFKRLNFKDVLVEKKCESSLLFCFGCY